jgi:putative endonuclease
MDGEMLVIVEVKTRSTDSFGYPEEAVNRRKQRFLIEAANEYILEHDLMNEVRYDVVAIIYENSKRRLLHIKDAFIPGL